MGGGGGDYVTRWCLSFRPISFEHMDKDLGIIDAALSHVFIPFRFGAMILCMHADEDASA